MAVQVSEKLLRTTVAAEVVGTVDPSVLAVACRLMLGQFAAGIAAMAPVQLD